MSRTNLHREWVSECVCVCEKEREGEREEKRRRGEEEKRRERKFEHACPCVSEKVSTLPTFNVFCSIFVR